MSPWKISEPATSSLNGRNQVWAEERRESYHWTSLILWKSSQVKITFFSVTRRPYNGTRHGAFGTSMLKMIDWECMVMMMTDTCLLYLEKIQFVWKAKACSPYQLASFEWSCSPNSQQNLARLANILCFWTRIPQNVRHLVLADKHS